MPKIIRLDKEESLLLFERIINFIRKQEKGFFMFKKIRGAHGFCDWEDGIVLDYRKELVPTIIHECIHLLEFDWSESQVSYAESRVINSITEDDVVRLLMFFVKKV